MNLLNYTLNVFRFLVIGLWSVFAICTSLLLMLISGNKKLPLNMARTFWSPVVLWAAGGRVKVKGLDNLVPGKSYIFVSNHQSFLDIPSLFRTIPFNLHFLGKEELRKLPFIGWFMKSVGMIFVDRSSRNKSYASLKQAGSLLNEGNNLIVFPEGTRSLNGKIGRFKKGTFLIAREAQATIVPVHIGGSSGVWPAKSNLLKPGPIELTVGAPINGTEQAERSLEDLAHLVRERVVELGHKAA